MAIPVPELDDRTWADLVDEARAMIPVACPGWTHHNASDPGIALVELLAWFTEMLAFEVGQVSETRTRAFLRLLAVTSDPPRPDEPAPAELDDLDRAVRETLQRLRAPFRAVTTRDYEELVAARWPDRVRLVRARTRDTAADDLAAAVVDVIVLPVTGTDLAVTDDVKAFLDERRMLTTQVEAAWPVFVDVGVRADVAVVPDARAADVAADATSRVVAAFGLDSLDVAFGRPLALAAVYAVLADTAGVDHVEHVRLTRDGELVDPGEDATIEEHELIRLTAASVDLTTYALSAGWHR